MKYPGPRTARIAKELIKKGWSLIYCNGSGHYALIDPCGRRRMTLPSTPKRNRRTDMNNVRDIKRARRAFDAS